MHLQNTNKPSGFAFAKVNDKAQPCRKIGSNMHPFYIRLSQK